MKKKAKKSRFIETLKSQSERPLFRFLLKLIERLTKLKDFISLVFEKFRKDFGGQRAASLSYTSFISFVPIALLVMTIITSLNIYDNVELQIQEFIANNFLPTQAEIITEYLQTFSENLAATNVLSVIAFLFAGIALLISLEKHLNAVWKVEKSRKLLHAMVSFWAVLTLGPVLLGASFILAKEFRSISEVRTDELFRYLSVIFSLVLTALFFILTQMLVPNIKVRFKAAFIGGLFSSISYEIFRMVYRVVANHLVFNKIYGSIAVIFLFLIWVYIFWHVFLIGSVIAYYIQFPPVQKKIEVTHRNLFTREILIYLFIIKRFAEPEHLIDENVIQEHFPQFKLEEIDIALDSLSEYKLIMYTEERGFIPYYEPARQTLGDTINTVLGLNLDDDEFLDTAVLKKKHPEFYELITELNDLFTKQYPRNLTDVIAPK